MCVYTLHTHVCIHVCMTWVQAQIHRPSGYCCIGGYFGSNIPGVCFELGFSFLPYTRASNIRIGF